MVLTKENHQRNQRRNEWDGLLVLDSHTQPKEQNIYQLKDKSPKSKDKRYNYEKQKAYLIRNNQITSWSFVERGNKIRSEWWHPGFHYGTLNWKTKNRYITLEKEKEERKLTGHSSEFDKSPNGVLPPRTSFFGSLITLVFHPEEASATISVKTLTIKLIKTRTSLHLDVTKNEWYFSMKLNIQILILKNAANSRCHRTSK